MKSRWIVGMVLFVGALGLAAGRAFTEEDPKEMEEWMKLGNPGPEHKALAAMAGDWTIDGKHWYTGSEQPMKASSKLTALFDGRYVREDFRGDFQGKPFEGIGHLGYDNATRKYVGTWIDSMSTAIMSMTGTYDAAKKTYTYESSMIGPGGKEKKHRHVMQIVSDKEMLGTMYMIGDEGEKKSMEMRYTRK